MSQLSRVYEKEYGRFIDRVWFLKELGFRFYVYFKISKTGKDGMFFAVENYSGKTQIIVKRKTYKALIRAIEKKITEVLEGN